MFFMFVIFVSFIAGLWLFISIREHLLVTLLSLEFMVLFIYSLFLVGLDWGGWFYSLIYLIMTACEGALGLSILVVMGRTHGGDYFKCLNLFG